MTFVVKTRKDRIIDQLRDLADTVQVSDVKFVVGASQGKLSAANLDEERRSTFKNKYDLARNVIPSDNRMI